MKVFITVSSAVLFIVLCCTIAYGQDSIKVMSKLNDASIDENYIKGVESNNLGLKVSATYYLGERGSGRAVIPLMAELHDAQSPDVRIIAALSLFKIGDARGIYAIKEAMTQDSDERVRNMCGIFYQMYLENKNSKK